MSKVNKFLLITFAINWTIAAIFSIFFSIKENPIAYTLIGALYMLVPAIVTMSIEKFRNWKSLGLNFRPNRWFLIAWLGVPVACALALAVNVIWPGVEFTPDMSGYKAQLDSDAIAALEAQQNAMPVPMIVLLILSSLSAGITINAVAALGEELGWRGFMVREYSDLKFWNVALRIGVIWGVWHAPLILLGHNYPQHPVIGVGMMTVWCIMLSIIILYIRLKAKSVIACAIMHGTINASAGIVLIYISGGNDLINGFTGFTGFIAAAIIIALIALFDSKISKDKIMSKKISEVL